MTFLPIVARELRVASRRTSTFYGRLIIAAVSIVIGGFLFLLSDGINSAGGRYGGSFVFKAVSWYIWLIAMLAGVLLASDCISEERREGTLGFLFLTDLKGYDVVLGKFAGVSLNAFYGMLAVFPILGISMLAGGVTVGEFWRVCLVLVNTLFFSVAVSMWVSANSKSAARGMIIAISLLIVFLAIWLAVSSISSFFPSLAPSLFYFGAISPLSSFNIASEADYLFRSHEFWTSLLISHGVGWVFLGLASWRLAFFTEKAREKSRWQSTLTQNILGTRAKRGRELLSINPILWMVGDSGRLRWIVWTIGILGSASFFAISTQEKYGALMFTGFVGWPFYFVLHVLCAIQACRFFSDARRSGALELLCCTPLTMRTIISGQWMALKRIFLWPVIILLISQIACLCFAWRPSIRIRPIDSQDWFYTFMMVLQVGKSAAGFFAVGWFGMWLALTLRKPSSATGLTILFVLVLPPMLFCIPTLLIDAVFIAIGYSKLRQDFRSPMIASRAILAHPSAT